MTPFYDISDWKEHPLFRDNNKEIEGYAREVLTKYGLPAPGWGLVWTEDDGGLVWRRHGDAHDPVAPLKCYTPPPAEYLMGLSAAEVAEVIRRRGKPRPECSFDSFAGERADLFLNQWPQERTMAQGLPGSFEAVYAFRWLSALDSAATQDSVSTDTTSGIASELGLPSSSFYDQTSEVGTPTGHHLYLAGVKAGQSLGAILYEWRMHIVFGPDILKQIERLFGHQKAAAQTAAFRTMWCNDAFPYAMKVRKAKPEITTDELATETKAFLDEHRARSVEGLKPEAAKKKYPNIPARERIIRQLREWENKGFQQIGADPKFLPKKVLLGTE